MPREVCPAQSRAISWTFPCSGPHTCNNGLKRKSCCHHENRRTLETTLYKHNLMGYRECGDTEAYTNGSIKVQNAKVSFHCITLTLAVSPTIDSPFRKVPTSEAQTLYHQLGIFFDTSWCHHCSNEKEKIAGVPSIIVSYYPKNKQTNNLSLSPIALYFVPLPQVCVGKEGSVGRRC